MWKSYLINAVSSKNFAQKMKKIDEKSKTFLKRFVTIEFLCFVCYDNAEIEKTCTKIIILFIKDTEILQILWKNIGNSKNITAKLLQPKFSASKQ